MTLRISMTTLLLAGIFGCDTNPTEGKSQAQVSAPVEATAKPTESATKYVFSAQNSKISWVGAKVTRKHDGAFGAFSGNIRLADGKVENGSVTVAIETASVSSDTEKLTGHLKSADFFEVEKYPKAAFTSTNLKTGGERGATHTVTGNLDLHGVTKSITFPATIRVQGDGVAVDAEFGINRKDFGIVYPGAPDDLIKDEVLIKLELRAKKAEPDRG